MPPEDDGDDDKFEPDCFKETINYKGVAKSMLKLALSGAVTGMALTLIGKIRRYSFHDIGRICLNKVKEGVYRYLNERVIKVLSVFGAYSITNSFIYPALKKLKIEFIRQKPDIKLKYHTKWALIYGTTDIFGTTLAY